ncbi:hypothetical protein D3C87_2056960 [compost metagenome]
MTFVFHEAGDGEVEGVTRALLEKAIALKGRPLLPGKPFATPEQFQAAYPTATRFFDAKRRYDPDERFQNQLYLRYGR